MIRITNTLSVPEDEITFTASRSGGPGGQNVNKVSTKVTLSFDIARSGALSDDQKTRIAEKLAPRMNKDGILQVVSQRTRSQEANRIDALARFAELLRRALTPERARIKTRMPSAAREERLQQKRKRSTIKEGRSGKRMGLMIHVMLAAALMAFAPRQTPPPYSIGYHLAMSHPASHLFEVTIDVGVPAADTAAYVDFQMPMWQPGRYSVADFAANVQEFNARSQNRSLAWAKVDDQTWRVQKQGTRNITVTYKVFGDDLSGTYAQLDVGHANYTGGELFMYVAGHKPDPVELHIEPPAGWRVVNGRTEKSDQHDWKYPNYEILIDNPTEIGAAWTEDNFKVTGKTFHVVIHSRGDEGGRRPSFVRDLEKIVRVETAMWGTPEFDHYTFLFHFAADDRSGDGMEHLTSTQIIEPRFLADSATYDDALATAAHEFFHAWNVKRLRPIELGPWDWTKPAFTRGLWIAEGFTQYYGVEMYHRAGLQDSSGFLRDLADTIGTIENSPANALMSAEASSMAAPFIDLAMHRQRTNLSNTSLSYYLKGELIALNLDLLIRGWTRGQRSLDDVMRRAYEEFYVKSPNATYYLKGRGYTIEDFARVVSEVAGRDMTDWFAKYVRGVEPLPYDDAFRSAGLRLVKTPASQPYSAGIVLDRDERQTLRLGTLRSESPAERAGLQQGDVLLSIDGTSVSRDNWFSVLNRRKQGDRVPVTVRRFGRTVDATLELGPPEIYDYRIEEIPNPPGVEKSVRSAWLDAK
jgi:predicted metalloprotease with PDZ domain